MSGTHERKLDNGLTVIVRVDRSAPVVAVVTYVRAGYFDEPDPVAGISHVLEHMYFKGTPGRGPGAIARETKAAGGYLNAGTIYDHTSYYTVLPSTSLDDALDIQADALLNSAIDEDELERELRVIMEEAKRKLDSPGAFAQETLFATMFDVHRMRRWRIGTPTVLGRLTAEDVRSFYRSMYRAPDTILVIAGDVEPDRVFALVESAYGGMDARPAERDRWPGEPPRHDFRYRAEAGDIAQTHIEWGWRTPGPLHDDTPALDVLAVAIGQGRASRLYRHVRDGGAVASITAYNYTPGDIGVFGLSATLDPEDEDAATVRTAGVLHGIRERGFTDEEAARARNLLEARHLRQLETVEGQANMIAAWQALGDWRLADEYMRNVAAVTAADLKAVAERHLEPGALTVLHYRPRDARAARADDGGMHVRRVIDQAVPLPVVTAAEESGTHEQAGGHPPRRMERAATATRAHAVEDGVHFYATHEHGARIVVMPRPSSPIVAVGLYCRGGRLAETPDTAGMTTLMARTSVRGTRTRTASELAEASESLGASISASADADLTRWTTSAPARHFDAVTELLVESALEPAFDGDQAERERKVMLSSLEQLRDDMHQYPLRLALAQGFADHPYGFDVADLERSVAALDVARLSGWHRTRILSSSPLVVVVGGIADPDAAAAHVGRLLEGRLAPPIELSVTPPEWPASPGSRVERRDKAQTAIVLAFPGPDENDPDAYAMRVLAAAIGGLGGRLFEELRSRRSLGYAVSAGPLTRWQAGAFTAYIGTSPDREDEARSELLHEILRTRDDLLDHDELERARRYLIGSWQISQQTNGRRMSDLARALLIGGGLDDLRLHEQRLREVTADRIRTAARRWLSADRVVEGIVRGT